MPSKILLADPSLATARAVELALPAQEFEIRRAADGLGAIRLLSEDVPDAVLLGFGLAGKDGYDVAAFLRSQPVYRTTALIFLAGAFEPLDGRKLSTIDHDGIIRKPFDGESLLGLVRGAVDRRKELPSLPEEPVFDAPPPPASNDAAAAAAAEWPEWTDEVERRVRDVIRQEIARNQAEMEERARDIVSAEFRKVLVQELKAADGAK